MSDSDDFDVEEPVLAEDDPMRAFLPTAFGKKSKEANIARQIDQSRRKVEPQHAAPRLVEKNGDDDDESDRDSSSSSSSSADDADEFPVSHELLLKTHDRAITTVSLDPAGSRLITGSLDGTVRFHDFASMTPTTLKAFRSVDPWESRKAAASSESHPIHHVQFSPLSGSVFLCVTAHPQAKIMSRDGDIVTEFVKGDMYLRDMNNTRGHVGEVSTGCWHPSDQNICLTAGSDSTLRIWDIDNKRSQTTVIVVKSRAAGSAGRTRMTAAAWGTQKQGGHNVLVAAALDGTLVMYSGNGPFTRPAGEIQKAHEPGTWTGGLDISSDGRMVVTRGGDDTIKLWDTRKFKEPLVKVEHPSTSDRFPMTNIRYAPDSTSIITGSATGHLHILNPGNLRPELVTPVTPGSPLIVVDWHAKLNQIITGSANAETHVLYSPNLSHRGAAEVMSRAPKKRHIDDDPALTMDQSGLSADAIVTPGAMSSGGMASLMRGRRSNNTDLSASGRSRDPRRPQAQLVTPFGGKQPDEKHIEKNIPLSKMLHEDPREALLRYADIANKDPMFTGAWKDTQPVTQYADASDEEEAADGAGDGPERKKVKR